MARGAPRANARHPSIRRLAVLAALAVIGIASVDAAANTWAREMMQRSNGVLDEHVQSRETARELALALTEYQRLSDLGLATRDATLRHARARLAARIPALTDRALVEAADNTREWGLLEALRVDVDAFVRRREAMHGSEIAPPDADPLDTPSLDRALRRLEEVRALNEVQVQAARQEAMRADGRAALVEYCSLTLMIVVMLGGVFAVRRYLARPILELSRTIASVRTGARLPEASERGTHETVELARAFNAMVEVLTKQREQQFAFLGGVAHDLRGPLSAVAMSVELVESSPEEASRTVPRLKRQVERLRRMLDDILDAARIEAGHLELRSTRFELGALVEGVVALYRGLAPERRVVLRRPDEEVHLHADPLRVEQVVYNLVSNAIKYAPPGLPIDVAIEPSERHIVVAVIDRGIGMTPAQIEDVFAPFRRHASGIAPGTGLGLSVVRRIVDAHGGWIHVESTKGGGSTFRVAFPRVRCEPVREVSVAMAPKPT